MSSVSIGCESLPIEAAAIGDSLLWISILMSAAACGLTSIDDVISNGVGIADRGLGMVKRGPSALRYTTPNLSVSKVFMRALIISLS